MVEKTVRTERNKTGRKELQKQNRNIVEKPLSSKYGNNGLYF